MTMLQVPGLPPDLPPLTPHEARVARRLYALRRDARREVSEQQRRWRYRVRRGRVEFDHEIAALHARLRQSLPAYLRDANPFSLLTAPIIYSLLLPFVLLDAWTTAYQWICFPIYGVARVRRAPYFVLDRHKLQYLNAIEKANCTFCTYANGVIAYVREVAARTEQFWCPIKHGSAVPEPHARYHHFFDYGDGGRYHRDLLGLRGRLRPPAAPPRRRRRPA
jgi:hypothetical protein